MSGYFYGRNGRLSKTWRFRRCGKSVKTLGNLRDLRDLGHLQFEEICWHWNYCHFTWQVLKILRYHTSHHVGGLFEGTLVVRFDIGSLWGLFKIYKTPVCHDCLVVNGTSKLIINISSRHGC